MKLKGRLVQVKALTGSQRDAMLALMHRHYENVNPASFAADLAEKQWVILLTDAQTEKLCGFSTQVLLDVTVAGKPVQALFSGDTIVDRDHWGDQALAHVWGRFALSLIDRRGGAELYWFLISKGYKTYRFLPLFFREFYPRWDHQTPTWAQAVLDALSRHKYPATYDAVAGVVRADGSQDRLRPGLAELTAERLCDPHVRFFAERNPGHAGGDELCCLAPLTRANFTRAAYRVIGPEAVTLAQEVGA
jgi:hypothetical protein